MSFCKYWGKFHIPETPSPIDETEDVWWSDGTKDVNFLSANNYIISKSFTGNLVCRLGTFEPVYRDVNGGIYFIASGWYLYRVGLNQWIISNRLGGNLSLNGEGGYVGNFSDPFYDGEFEFKPSGSFITENETLANLGRAPRYDSVFLKWDWEYWKRTKNDTRYGEYVNPKTTEKRYVGYPAWKSGADAIYLKTGSKTYTGITHIADGDKWVIGTYQDENGWYESNSEPSKDRTTAFKFTLPENSEKKEQNEDIVLAFDKYVDGRELGMSKDVFVFEVAVWK